MATEVIRSGTDLSHAIPSANIDRRLGNLYPESIAWKKTHSEAVAYIVDKLITNERKDTKHSEKFRNLLESYRPHILFAARHHDIGILNLGTDITPQQAEAIVNKDGPLSDPEIAIMNRHPLAGVNLLESVGVTNPLILAIVAMHHTVQSLKPQYPESDDPELVRLKSMLNKDELDVVATATRLVALADTVRAIREKRPYDDERSVDVAYAEAHMERTWDDKQISCAQQHCKDSLKEFPINLVLPLRRGV